MATKPTERVRNLGIIAHIDAGKTTTTERFLYYSGRSHKIGEVHDGQAIMDFREDERERGITISSAATTFYWNDCELNLIDTPGHVDFTAEVERSLRVLDGAVVIFDGVEGVEPQSETVWHQADRYDVPRICFVNKMDRIGADFFSCVEQIRERLGARPLPIVLPMGASEDLVGVLDVIGRCLLVFDRDSQGERYERLPVPAGSAGFVEEHRRRLIEELANHDDGLSTLFLEERPIGEEELRAALRRATVARAVTPVLAGAALRNIGVQPLLDAVCLYLPSPLDAPPARGHDPATGEAATREPRADAPFSAYIFKIVSAASADLFYARVYSGSLAAGSPARNVRSGERERIRRILRMHAQHGEPVETIEAGDIVAFVGMKSCATGDTLADERHPIQYEPIHFPDTVVSVSVEPKTSAERDKLADVLRRIAREDPTFRQSFDADTGQTILSGMGELHLDVVKNRMIREFNVQANFGKPRVSYRETFTGPASGRGEFARALGTQQLWAEVEIGIEPFADHRKPEAVSRLHQGRMPEPMVDGMLDSLLISAEGGGLYGFPLINVRIVLLEARYAETGSAEIAVNAAAAAALRDALRKGRVTILEPIMKFEVRCPEEYLGGILKNLGGRRAQIEDTKFTGKTVLVRGTVPLAEMFGYSTSLRSQSQGRGSFNLEPFDYSPVPEPLRASFQPRL